jgi:Carboxypeptidase regulatory-like domain
MLKGLVVVFALGACGVSPVLAQQDAATVLGEVTDASGGLVPGATVTVTNVATGISLTTTTNERGVYSLPGLRPGDYTVTIELQGFTKFVRGGITLQVAQVLRLDAALQTGNVTETVQVESAASLLQTDVSSRGSVIDERKIVNLPLNGRDYNQLALLSPGVLPGTPRLASVNFKGVLNVNGNRTFNNVFLLDGVDNISYSNSFRGENVQLVQPSIEALQEFKIQTNAYSAEYGRSSGAVVNAVIKSGTNSLRGSAYEFVRNDALDANNYFSKLLGAPKPKRERNQFGGAQPRVLVCRLRRTPRPGGHPARAPGTDRRREGRAVSLPGVRSLRAGPPRVRAKRAGSVGDPARAVGSRRGADRRAHPRSKRGGIDDLRVDAGDRHPAGSVRRSHRSSGG